MIRNLTFLYSNTKRWKSICDREKN